MRDQALSPPISPEGGGCKACKGRKEGDGNESTREKKERKA